MAYMDYMDLDVHCLRKAIKTLSLTHLLLSLEIYSSDQVTILHMSWQLSWHVQICDLIR